MKPGKKPMPNALKVLTGNERYINKNEPEPDKPLETGPPVWLSDKGREKYKELFPKLIGLGMVKETDIISFDMMFIHWDLAHKAAKNLREDGITIKDNRRVERKNPNLQAFRDNSLAYLRYASLFGLDPSSRSSMSVDVIDENDPLVKLFRDKENRRKNIY